MKRKSYSKGRKGNHGAQHIYRPAPQHVIDHNGGQGDAAAFGRFAWGCLGAAAITLVLLLLAAVKCHAQTHFEFTTSTVIMCDTAKATNTYDPITVGNTSWNIKAWSDTLKCGPLLWYGVKWEKTNTDLFCMTPYFRAQYSPGPGGKALLVIPSGAIKWMQFLERKNNKL